MSSPAFTPGEIVQVAPPAGKWGGSLLIVGGCECGVVWGFAQVQARGFDPRFEPCRVSIDLVHSTGGRVALETEPGPPRDAIEIEPFYDGAEAWA